VALTDGKFLGSCRPGRLGNQHSLLDQSQLYTGEKASHGIKHLGAFFSNGMMALCGPFLGSVHDGQMIRESGWIEYLSLISQFDGRSYKIFGDSAFGCTNYVQSMIKGELTPDWLAFNALIIFPLCHVLGKLLIEGLYLRLTLLFSRCLCLHRNELHESRCNRFAIRAITESLDFARFVG
jgi:hypothetical protein